MATLRDIAESLGLSVMAVSKGLRDAPDISAATKQRIYAEAQRLGYIPNSSARSLRNGNTWLFGLILPSLDSPEAGLVLKGAQQAAAEAGYDLLVAGSEGSPDQEGKALDRMLARQVRKIVVMPSSRARQRSPLLGRVGAGGFSLVFLNQYPAAASQYRDTSRVTADWYRAGVMAVEQLTQRGHRKLGYLAGSLSGSAAAEHYRGVTDAAAVAKVSIETVFVEADGIEAGWAGFDQLRTAHEDFSAVIAVSDLVALGAIESIRSRSRRLARKISVVGCGDLPISRHGPIPLSTIRIPWEGMGRQAVLQLLQEKTPPETVFPVAWIERESVNLFEV
jgi:LacI family transcriptional regulator